MSNKAKLILVGSLFGMLIIILVSVFVGLDRRAAGRLSSGRVKVDINQIEHQMNQGDIDGASENVRRLVEDTDADDSKQTVRYVMIGGISVIFASILLSYIYVAVIRPFDRLSDFASRVAAGDLDVPLEQERGQYFGKFTWAFDSMRKEIKKAREAELTAIENNKTVIATLSHDIKTPISSIRTYCEALEANLDRTPEKRAMYLNTIMDKCDEVGRLTDDLFVHSVSDMNQLSVSPARIELKSYMSSTVKLLSADDKVNYNDQLSEGVYVKADPARLTQILENLIANAGKYAGTTVDISTVSDENSAVIRIRDYGDGIPEENLPFITQKFYRGNNVEGIPGSGLGLYICNYLAEKMDADIDFRNVYEGDICRGFACEITISRIA